jgi:hypothetical protein
MKRLIYFNKFNESKYDVEENSWVINNIVPKFNNTDSFNNAAYQDKNIKKLKLEEYVKVAKKNPVLTGNNVFALLKKNILEYMDNLPSSTRNIFNNPTDDELKAKKWMDGIPKLEPGYESIINSGVFLKYIQAPIMDLVKTYSDKGENYNPELVWLILPWFKKLWEKYNGEFYGVDLLRHQANN